MPGLVGLALQEPCATLRILPEAAPVRTGVLAAASGPRALRDPYDVPNLVTGEHFVVRWGNSGGVDADDAQALLADFEVAWAAEVDGMGHPAPYGTDAYLFNVYVGDTGDGAPPSYGAGGYYTVDWDGWPMIVVAAVSLWDPSYRAHTAAHEFYHALQGVTSRYDYDGESAWYWEATAEWAALQVDPTNPQNGPFLFGYLLLPTLPVNAFDYPDTGALSEYHQYGAFLFPHDLTEEVGFELVRDTWLDDGSEPDPLEVMRGWLADRDHDLDELWVDHVARASAFDYPLGDAWEDQVGSIDGWYEDGDFTSEVIRESGGDGQFRAARAPQRYGTVRIEHRDPDPGVLEVVIDGDEQGTNGNPAELGARLVRLKDDGAIRYRDVPFDGVHGELVVDDVGPDDRELLLVVTAWTGTNRSWDDEKFPLTWSMTISGAGATSEEGSFAPIPPTPEMPVATCSCDAGGGPLPGVALAALLLARRRGRCRSSA